MTKPKLVQIFANSSSSPGGAERVLGQISQTALAAGFEVEEYSNQSCNPRPWSRRFPMFNVVGNVWQLNRFLAEAIRRADIVISHGMYGAFVRHPRHVYVLHSTYAQMADSLQPYVHWLDFAVCRYVWGGLLERRNARRAQCVAVSQAAAEECRRYYGVDSHVIYNSVNPTFRRSAEKTDDLRNSLGLPQNEILLLVVGRRETLKGCRLLGPLAARLPRNARLVSIGSGPPIEGVLCLPPCSQDRIPAVYSAVDWVVAPSLYEGFGLTVLESWACGTPVIASPTGIVKELRGLESTFDRCVAAVTGQVAALEAAVVSALSGDTIGPRQVAWAQSYLKSRFSFASFQANWTNFLNLRLGVPR